MNKQDYVNAHKILWENIIVKLNGDKLNQTLQQLGNNKAFFVKLLKKEILNDMNFTDIIGNCFGCQYKSDKNYISCQQGCLFKVENLSSSEEQCLDGLYDLFVTNINNKELAIEYAIKIRDFPVRD